MCQHALLPVLQKGMHAWSPQAIKKLGMILNLANIMFAHAGCGPECTHDGLHYSNATYDAALQVWMNSLLVD